MQLKNRKSRVCSLISLLLTIQVAFSAAVLSANAANIVATKGSGSGLVNLCLSFDGRSENENAYIQTSPDVPVLKTNTPPSGYANIYGGLRKASVSASAYSVNSVISWVPDTAKIDGNSYNLNYVSGKYTAQIAMDVGGNYHLGVFYKANYAFDAGTADKACNFPYYSALPYADSIATIDGCLLPVQGETQSLFEAINDSLIDKIRSYRYMLISTMGVPEADIVNLETSHATLNALLGEYELLTTTSQKAEHIYQHHDEYLENFTKLEQSFTNVANHEQIAYIVAQDENMTRQMSNYSAKLDEIVAELEIHRYSSFYAVSTELCALIDDVIAGRLQKRNTSAFNGSVYYVIDKNVEIRAELEITPGSDLHTIDNSIVSGAVAGKTALYYLQQFEDSVVIKRGDTVLDYSSLVATGDKIVCGDISFDVSVKRDVSGDGKFNSYDAIYALRIIAELSESSAVQVCAGDFNDNGAIDTYDIVKMLRFIAEIE